MSKSILHRYIYRFKFFQYHIFLSGLFISFSGMRSKSFRINGFDDIMDLDRRGSLDAGNRCIALSLSLSFCSFLSLLLFNNIAHTHILRNSGCCIATCNARRSAAALGFDRAKNSGLLAGKRIGNDAHNAKGHDPSRARNGSLWTQAIPLGHSCFPYFIMHPCFCKINYWVIIDMQMVY